MWVRGLCTRYTRTHKAKGLEGYPSLLTFNSDHDMDSSAMWYHPNHYLETSAGVLTKVVKKRFVAKDCGHIGTLRERRNLLAAKTTKMYDKMLFRRAMLHNTVASFRSMRRGLDPEVSIGFVPTMGALHEGKYWYYTHATTVAMTSDFLALCKVVLMLLF